MKRQPPRANDRFSASRRESRDRNRKKRDFAGGIRTVLWMALAAECVRVIFFSPRLRLVHVQVQGSRRVDAVQVAQLGGVRLGQNIFHVNLVRVSERLTRNPIIDSAVVTRELPGTLQVQITERTPAFQVTAPTGTYNADQNGVVFERAAARNAKLPLLKISAREFPPLGSPLKPDLVQTFWDCSRLARRAHLRMVDLRVDDGRGVDDSAQLWLNTETSAAGPIEPRPLTVCIGEGTELPEKFRDIYTALHSEPDLTSKASYLNVMSAGHPAYKAFADGAEGAGGAAASP